MITETYDVLTEAIIKRPEGEDKPYFDACIMTFSYRIMDFVLEHFECEKIGEFSSVNGGTPVYRLHTQNGDFALFQCRAGAPGCVGNIEESTGVFRTKKFILFGGAGCLDKEIAHGRVMVPTAAYRDEGTSYHYAPASDYITVKNSGTVAAFMRENGLPYVEGKTWTTDAFYRETRGNMARRKAEGCISVEMEGAAVQAVCDFRGLEVYIFFTSGDLLDAPVWDRRRKDGEFTGTQHDIGHFDIALELARFVVRK